MLTALALSVLTLCTSKICSSIELDHITAGSTLGDPNVSSFLPASPHPVTIPGLTVIGILSEGNTSGQVWDSQTIKGGSFLFSPRRKQILNTKFGVVTIRPKSIALLFVTKQSLSLYSLAQSCRDGISLLVNGRVREFEPGDHVTVADDQSTNFAAVNCGQSISHRNWSTDSSEKLKVFRSEFNIFSAINSIENLRKIVADPGRSQRGTVNHLLKAAAVQNDLAHGGGRVIQADGPVTFQFVVQ